MSTIIGIFALLTTALIGFQIYQAINIVEIKKDILRAKDETLGDANKMLLYTTHGLADFYIIRYMDCPDDAGGKEKSTLCYNAMFYLIATIKQSIKVDSIPIYITNVNKLNALISVGNICINQNELLETIRMLEDIPVNQRTQELNMIIDKLCGLK